MIEISVIPGESALLVLSVESVWPWAGITDIFLKAFNMPEVAPDSGPVI